MSDFCMKRNTELKWVNRKTYRIYLGRSSNDENDAYCQRPCLKDQNLYEDDKRVLGANDKDNRHTS